MRLYDKAKLFEQMVAQAQELPYSGTPAAPESLISGAPPVQPGALSPAKPQFPSIPTDVQQKLSNLMVSLNIGTPLKKIDGKLGPETDQAIKNYKKYYGLGNMNNQMLFNHIKMNSETKPAGNAAAPSPTQNDAYPLSDLKRDVGNLGKPFVPKAK